MSSHRIDRESKCPDETTLRQFLADALTESTESWLDDHLKVCSTCREQLDRLIGGQPDPLAPVGGQPGAAGDEDRPDIPEGEVLGRIDAGGMGDVWLVHDRQFQRALAVKVMKVGDSQHPERVERFVREARMSARLTHPFIVPVHSMGRLADGRPYYTMKLVEGETLAARLRARSDPAQKRTELLQVFADVCQAVAFAHDKGVLHRDLKPGNVMIGAHGEVQVMDWGLGKELPKEPPLLPPEIDPGATTPPETEAGSPDLTRHGVALGTLPYMPPEQALGGTVDRRADVFGLGAILCELLTGHPPYRATEEEIDQVVREDLGHLGRADLDKRNIARRMILHKKAGEGDLADAWGRLDRCEADDELIALARKCLAPRTGERPADAGEVARAMADYLSGVQERAEQERLEAERQRVKAVEERRRRRLWAGLTASMLATVVLLAIGLFVVNHLREKEREARSVAEQREQETRTVMDELSSAVIEDWLARQPQLTPEQKAFLEKGLAYYEKFTQETGETPEGRAALARAYRRVGTIRQQLNMIPEAEAALRQAVATSRALADEFPGVPAYEREAAGALHTQAVLLSEDRLDYEGAVTLLQEAIERQQRARQQDLHDPRAREDLAKHHISLGDALRSLQSQRGEAEAAYDEALRITERLAAEFPENRRYQLILGVIHNQRGSLFVHLLRRKEAEAAYGLAVQKVQPLADEFPFVPEYQRVLADASYNHGRLLRLLSRYDEARDALTKARKIYERMATIFPSVPGYLRGAAQSYNVLGNTLIDLGLLDEAEAARLEAITFLERLTRRFTNDPSYQLELGGSYNNFGILLYDRGRPADALPWFDKALEQVQPIHARNPDDATARRFLRNIYWSQAEALDLLDRHADAAGAWEQAVGFDDGSRRLLLQARLALDRGEYPEAVALANKQAEAPGVISKTFYDCARICARAAGATSDPGLGERAAASAVGLLKRAVDGGYANAERIRKHRDLDAIRGRPEYQEIMKGLEARRKPQP